jgi:glycosyltransferase involved in cell wall biosynthesis
MHVLIAGTSFLPNYGGPAFSVSGLATNVAKLGLQVTVWAPDGSAADTPLLETPSGALGKSGSVQTIFGRLGRVDLIHDNGVWLPHNHALAACAVRYGIPRIVSTRGMLEPWSLSHKRIKKRVAWYLYQRRDLRRATYLHATAEEERQNVQRFNLGVPVHVVPNGVALPALSDLRQFPQEHGEERIALYMGRIHSIKGLPLLLRAWSAIRPRNWRLVIAGPDETGHRRQLEEMVRFSGLKQHVHFAGAIAPERKTEMYANASLFVLPTFSENFGVSISEALGHRIPVITTMGAPWPLLASKGCGWRVAPDADSIAAALAEATACEPATLFEMGIKGRAYIAAEFAWSSIAQRMSAVYEAAVRGSADSPKIPSPPGSDA